MSVQAPPDRFKPTGVPVTYQRRTDWPVWVLSAAGGMAAGPVVGAGYSHPMLVAGALGVFGLVFFIMIRLSLKSLIAATWLSLFQVMFAVGVAVGDVVVSRRVLVVPVVSLMVTAVLSTAAALLLLRRVRKS
jgi:hypothetical protein